MTKVESEVRTVVVEKSPDTIGFMVRSGVNWPPTTFRVYALQGENGFDFYELVFPGRQSTLYPFGRVESLNVDSRAMTPEESTKVCRRWINHRIEDYYRGKTSIVFT